MSLNSRSAYISWICKPGMLFNILNPHFFHFKEWTVLGLPHQVAMDQIENNKYV